MFALGRKITKTETIYLRQNAIRVIFIIIIIIIIIIINKLLLSVTSYELRSHFGSLENWRIIK